MFGRKLPACASPSSVRQADREAYVETFSDNFRDESLNGPAPARQARFVEGSSDGSTVGFPQSGRSNYRTINVPFIVG